MSLDTIFAGESIHVPGLSAFSALVPLVPGITPAADLILELGPPEPASDAGRLEVRPGVWVECHEQSGIVEIHDPRLFRPGRESFCRALAQSAVEDLQARGVEIALDSSTCRLAFNPGEFDRAELARRAAAAVTAATPALREQPLGAVRDASSLVDLALAGGSLTMAVAGAVLPGIPSLPFLMLTVRHAARLSPQFDQFLRRQSWASALLDHVENSGSLLRLDARCLPQVLLFTVFAAAVFLILHPPLPVVMALELGVMAVVCFRGAASGQDVRRVALV
jgi:uncharacterized membrane protein YbaN (DUF454 family)